MSQGNAGPLQNLNLDAQKPSSIFNRGLNATETGSADDAVLRFDANVPTIVGPGIAAATTAANGTIVTITRPGWYRCQLVGITTLNTAVDVGISANVAAAGLTTDPSFATAGMLVAQQGIGTGAITANLSFVLHANLEVLKGNSALVRFHATNTLDAAPDFSGTLATLYYRIQRLGDTRGHS